MAAQPRTAPPGHPVRRRRRRRGRRDDCGSATVEFALGAPLLLLIVALIWQVGVWAIGDLAARNAANHALQTSRVVGGTAPAGHSDAAALLAQNGGWFVVDPVVTVTRTPTVTTVTITGHARAVVPASIIPGLQPTITVTVQAPTERHSP